MLLPFRAFACLWLALSLLLRLPGPAPLEPAAQDSSRAVPDVLPNVVFITIDTLRADHLGCYGYKQIRTPHIDALAADGFRFERAFTPVPVTLPAHTAIFTGTYPLFSGMHDFSGNKLNPSQPTLASVLKQNGYNTAAVLGSAVLDSRFGLDHGFDFYYDHFDFNRLQESNLEEMERSGNVVADVTLDWLSKNYQSKFFLWMHLYDPHYPYRPPPPYSVEYKDRPYDGEIAFADAQVGRLIQFLKDKDLYRNTLIVLSGDHGESLGEHGEKTHGFFIYNATLHVPMIIHLPGQTSGQVVPDLVSLADLMPTVLHHLKIEVPAKVQGPTSAEPGPGTAQSTVASLDASSQAPSDSSGDGGAAGLRGGGGETVLMATALAAAQAFEGAQIAYAEDQRALLTLNALNSLGRILGGILGRKNLIWVTANLPFSFIPEDRTMTDAELAEDLPSMNTRRVGEHASGNYAATFRQSHAEEIRETADRLANAQVAVYPVDARGLSISTDTDSQEAMREMARETGGRAYVNQNEIRIGIERAFQDDAAAYTLGYYPENKKYDGKYRQIKVKVKREGVEFQNRRGYYALDPTLTKGYNPNQEVAAALDDTIPATLIAFTVRVQPPASNSVKGKLGVDFLVDVNTVSTEGISGNKKLNVLFYAMLYSSDGKMLSNQSMKVDQSFNNETYQNIVQHGMLLHMDVEPKTGGSQLRLAVQDNRTGLVGTIRAPVSNP